MNQPHPGLDQAPRQQARLSPGIAPVAIAHPLRFTRKIEGRASLAGGHQVEGMVRQPVPRLDLAAALDRAEMAVDLREQIAAAIQASTRDVAGQIQAFNPVVRQSRIADEPFRLPELAEKARGLSGRGHVVVQAHDVGDPNRSQRRHPLARFEHLDDGAKVGPIVRLDLASAAGAVGIAGQDPVAADVVVVIVRTHRTDDGQLVGVSCGARQQLAEANAGNVGCDRPEGAADFRRRVRLRIERFVLRRSALQPQEDDVLGTAEGGALQVATERRRRRSRRGLGCTQQTGETQPKSAQAAHAQPFAAANAVAGAMV